MRKSFLLRHRLRAGALLISQDGSSRGHVRRRRLDKPRANNGATAASGKSEIGEPSWPAYRGRVWEKSAAASGFLLRSTKAAAGPAKQPASFAFEKSIRTRKLIRRAVSSKAAAARAAGRRRSSARRAS